MLVGARSLYFYGAFYAIRAGVELLKRRNYVKANSILETDLRQKFGERPPANDPIQNLLFDGRWNVHMLV